jgi:hypothetical protein
LNLIKRGTPRVSSLAKNNISREYSSYRILADSPNKVLESTFIDEGSLDTNIDEISEEINHVQEVTQTRIDPLQNTVIVKEINKEYITYIVQ